MNITYKKIMEFDPCYDPKEIGMPEDYSASLTDFINEYRGKVRELSNIHWVVLRNDFFSDRDLRLFGVWSARQVQHLMADERSIKALDVAQDFAFGNASQDNLDAARDAARAAWSARAAAWEAAWAATGRDAAWAAARAAREAAWAATVRDAAWAAAWAATARDATAREAARAAREAAWEAAWDMQIDMILKMLEKPNGEWFKDWQGNKNEQ